jgi:hypothetical protein
MKRGKWILKGLVAGIVFVLLAGTITMLLWNWLVPSLFHGPEIRFLQALGLLLLSKILFSGWGGHRWRHAGGPPWRQRLHDKWSSMTPEERERFKSRMREKWCRRPSGVEDQNAGSSNV